jgi:hypothetical protein
MEEARLRREREAKEAKELVKTHFGPEEDPFTADFTRTRDTVQKSKFASNMQ